MVPAAANQTDEEDIDIVGDSDRKNSSLTSSSDGGGCGGNGANVTQLVYGPPQYTEADVLACVSSHEAATSIKKENADIDDDAEMEDDEDEKRPDEDAATTKSEKSEDKSDNEDEEEEERENDGNDDEDAAVEKLKAKLRRLERNNQCSKCMVSERDGFKERTELLAFVRFNRKL